MHRYHIYLIKDRVAEHYFGREEKLFQLFKDCRSIQDKHLKEVMRRQVCYVSRQLDVNRIGRQLHAACGLLTEYTYEDPVFLLKSKKTGSEAALELKDREIKLTSEGTADLEVTFFEVLRQMDGHFLAMDFHRKQCAWLNPIKNADFLQSKVDLISRDSVH